MKPASKFEIPSGSIQIRLSEDPGPHAVFFSCVRRAGRGVGSRVCLSSSSGWGDPRMWGETLEWEGGPLEWDGEPLEWEGETLEWEGETLEWDGESPRMGGGPPRMGGGTPRIGWGRP